MGPRCQARDKLRRKSLHLHIPLHIIFRLLHAAIVHRTVEKRRMPYTVPMVQQFNDKKQEERLHDLRAREEEDLARVLSAKYGVEYIDLSSKSIDTDALRLVLEPDARAAEVAAFGKVNKLILVAMRAPERPDSLKIVQDIERLGYQVRRFIVSRASLEHAWDRYHDISYATETEAGVLTLSNETIAQMLGALKTIADVRTEIAKHIASKDTHRISRVLEVIMAGAMALGASDVHLEPQDNGVRMRYRLDGVLVEITVFDPSTYNLISSRLKLLSGLKLNIKNAAQDGRYSIVINEKEIEIRLSVLPGSYAETIVMRILDPSTIALSFEQLGFDKYLMDIFNHEINKPNGMILNTGPTGSGKTTTLYAFLAKVASPDVKVITIEDPIEYHLAGIVQTQVSKDYTFASGLRSTLRQDPDIIMVGEIRDTEVASTAVHASLTGHLVFSTLHTNDAAGTFPRLVDMGISPDILGAALTVAMAQRLVRRLCPHCRIATPIMGADKELIDTVLAHIPHADDLPANRETMWTPKGCEKCGGLGYKGRISVVEVILMDRQIEEAVRTTSSEREIWVAARHQGIRRMGEDGIAKVLQGVTSLEELGRVVDLEAEIAINASM
ncbi:type II/IV secretion system protein [Candidatus Kaiserbacteria bacterium]|nr:type II/IV secretion system protein [Candidatus Kaiserbacteria bacterium]